MAVPDRGFSTVESRAAYDDDESLNDDEKRTWT